MNPKQQQESGREATSQKGLLPPAEAEPPAKASEDEEKQTKFNPFQKPLQQKFIPADSQKQFKIAAPYKSPLPPPALVPPHPEPKQEYDAYLEEVYKVIDKIDSKLE